MRRAYHTRYVDGSYQVYYGTPNYVDYALKTLHKNYVWEFERALKHDWKLGVFAKKVDNWLESSWTDDLFANYENLLAESQLKGCVVSMPTMLFITRPHNPPFISPKVI